MTDQYRATPKQWDNQKAWAVDDDDSSCILELRARVEALEARYETQRQVTLAWGKDVYNHGRWIDAHLKRIKALEAGQKPNYPEIPDSSPAPADSLVEMPEAFQTLCAYARNYIEEHGDKSEADELECIIDLLSRTFGIPFLPPEATP
jgi:acyl-homoserine lactone acylase PvdQ